MKISGQFHQRRRLAAFSLIELIVVISIIALLAALLFPIVGKISERKQIAKATAELNEIKSAIEEYKTKLGYYPPDNTNNPVTNQLYFELEGTTNNGTAGNPPNAWGTLDGSALVDSTGTPNISSFFYASGMANTSAKKNSDDNTTAAQTFIGNLSPNQIGVIDPVNKPLVKILVCSIPWPADRKPQISTNPVLNPWCYNSSHPTNNVGGYDLWVDLVIRGKTNRISNWSPEPIKL